MADWRSQPGRVTKGRYAAGSRRSPYSRYNFGWRPRAAVHEFVNFMKKLSRTVRERIKFQRGFFGVFLLLMVLTTSLIRPFQVWLVVGIGFFVVIAVLQYYAFDRHIVDEVCDAGDALVFRKGDLEQTVMLADIDDIEIQNFATETGVTLHCRHVGAIGSRISFAARRGDRLFSTPEEIVNLLARVEDTKSA